MTDPETTKNLGVLASCYHRGGREVSSHIAPGRFAFRQLHHLQGAEAEEEQEEGSGLGV